MAIIHHGRKGEEYEKGIRKGKVERGRDEIWWLSVEQSDSGDYGCECNLKYRPLSLDKYGFDQKLPGPKICN